MGQAMIHRVQAQADTSPPRRHAHSKKRQRRLKKQQRRLEKQQRRQEKQQRRREKRAAARREKEVAILRRAVKVYARHELAELDGMLAKTPTVPVKRLLKYIKLVRATESYAMVPAPAPAPSFRPIAGDDAEIGVPAGDVSSAAGFAGRKRRRPAT